MSDDARTATPQMNAGPGGRAGLAFWVPFGFFVFALGYIAFTLTLPAEHMIGDVHGYDPGSRFMPLVTATLLAAIMLWETLKAGRKAQGIPASVADGSVPMGLLLANIALSIGFVIVFRPLGFILTTSVLLYVLTYLNFRHCENRLGTGAAMAGFVLAMAYVVGMYSAVRGVVRACFAAARQFALPLARDPNVQAALVVLTVIVLMWLAGQILRRFVKQRELILLLQTTVGIAMSVYVVFRMLFLVQLPTGPLIW